MRVTLSLLLTLILSYSSSSALDCDTIKNGGVEERDRLRFTCDNGGLKATHCVAEDKTAVAVGGTHEDGNYQRSCVRRSNDYAILEYSACLSEGRLIAPGGTLDVNSYWLSCVRQGDSLLESKSGCVHEGKHIKKGDKLRLNEMLLECRDQTPNPKMDPVACVSGNKELAIGEKFTDTDTWYICTVTKGIASMKAIGCVHNGISYDDGGVRVEHESQQLRVCKVTRDIATWGPHGCISLHIDGVTRENISLGCQRTERSANNLVQIECRFIDNQAVKVPVNCVYILDQEVNKAEVYVAPGRAETRNNLTIKCSDQLVLSTTSTDKTELKISSNN